MGLIMVLSVAAVRVLSVLALPATGVYLTWWGVGVELAVFAAGVWMMGSDLHETAAIIFAVMAFSVGEPPTVAVTLAIVVMLLFVSGARAVGTVSGAIAIALLGLTVAIALSWLGGAPERDGDAVRSKSGVFVASRYYAATGAWGSNHWIVYVESPFIPVIRRQVYLGPDGEPPSLVWKGPVELSVNGGVVSVFGPELIVHGE
jgi:hypothetical protein